jgi:hypothetical protein
MGANSSIGRQYFATTGEAGISAVRPGQYRSGQVEVAPAAAPLINWLYVISNPARGGDDAEGPWWQRPPCFVAFEMFDKVLIRDNVNAQECGRTFKTKRV